MEFKKAPLDLVDFIAEKMKRIDCECRQMFGYPAYFINGNMFAGLFGDQLLLRLSSGDVAETRKVDARIKAFEPMPGRAMKDYISLPKVVYSDPKEFDTLLQKSIRYASSLPPKKAKPKKE